MPVAHHVFAQWNKALTASSEAQYQVIDQRNTRPDVGINTVRLSDKLPLPTLHELKMTDTQHILEGEILENDEIIVKGLLSIFTTEISISARKNTELMFRGKELRLSPFSPKMFWGTAIKDGFQISMEGNKLGTYSNGPLGHPGDGEYEIYEVLQASIFGKYNKEGLEICMTAKTGRGRDVCYFAKEESVERHESRSVTVKFHVPREKLIAFLGFTNNGQHFWEMFNATV